MLQESVDLRSCNSNVFLGLFIKWFYFVFMLTLFGFFECQFKFSGRENQLLVSIGA